MLKRIDCLLFLSSFCLICHGQRRITDEPIDRQQEYIRQFIAIGECGGTNDTKCELVLGVARSNDWVLPMLEMAIVDLRRDEQANQKRIRLVLDLITDTGTKQALDIIVRLLDGRPEKAMFVRLSLLGDTDGRRFNTFDLWYYALDSTDRVVREITEEVLLIQVDSPFEKRHRQWAEAAIKRYGHIPTVSDWQTDPMMQLFWKKHPVDAPEKQRRITALADEITKRK